jgi:uncharacterized membrane protein HdeD (DUF308 family)
MVVIVETPFQQTLRRLGRAWAWILAYGIISVAAGVLALIWPGPTLVVIAILFAAQIIIGAVYQFAASFAMPGESGWLRALLAILAVVSFAVGLFLLGHPVLSLLVLVVMLGLYWVAHGVIELFVAVGHPELPGRRWMVVSGVLGIVAGAIALLVPGISLLALTLVLGAWLVVYGVVLAATAIRVHAVTRLLRPGAMFPGMA